MSVVVQRFLDAISLAAGAIAFNPIVSAGLLWLLTKAPLRLRQLTIDRIGYLRDPVVHRRVVKGLRYCVALGLIGVANRAGNQIALNNGRLRAERKRWNFSVGGGEVAVVTGGCSGIGSLVVKRLAGKGVKVVVLDVVEGLPEGLRGYADIKFFQCDITSPEAVYSTARVIQSTIGTPTILINNAGIFDAHTILDTPDTFLKKIFDVNVLSNWYTIKAFLPGMIKSNKGHIMTIASIASYIAVGGIADYTASKAAILAFHEALNQELRHHYHAPNILTTSVHPNWVRTPLLKPVEEELKQRGTVVLDPELVADGIVERVTACVGGQLFLPSGVGKVSALRGLPNWVQEGMRDGVTKIIMDSVKGT